MSEQLFTKENRQFLRDCLAKEVPGVPVRVQFEEEKDRLGYGYSDRRKVRVGIMQVCTATIYQPDPLRQQIYVVVNRWYESLRLLHETRHYREQFSIAISYNGKEAKRTLSYQEILAEIANYNVQYGKLIVQPQVLRSFKGRTTFALGVINQERTVLRMIEFDGNAGFCKIVSLLLEQGKDIREALLDDSVPTHAVLEFNL